ncbi:hypothetical protein DASC09_049010 [Saccharomycopsis crataegensis]|uniref:L domain-like protein n=1 Tax=Saccharomycopsis crataegensis TaxID=43959 RepID=A0AAV5QSM4_9ASCO|nr:hypothetical protein DASC09_049010 [Saccharomycopsis crataegensis]
MDILGRLPIELLPNVFKYMERCQLARLRNSIADDPLSPLLQYIDCVLFERIFIFRKYRYFPKIKLKNLSFFLACHDFLRITYYTCWYDMETVCFVWETIHDEDMMAFIHKYVKSIICDFDEHLDAIDLEAFAFIINSARNLKFIRIPMMIPGVTKTCEQMEIVTTVAEAILPNAIGSMKSLMIFRNKDHFITCSNLRSRKRISNIKSIYFPKLERLRLHGAINPTEIATLRYLDIFCGKFDEKIWDLQWVHNLEEFSIIGSKLSEISGINCLTEFKSLKIFTQSQIQKVNNLHGLSKLTNLDLSSNRIKEILMDFSEFPELRELNLSCNYLTSLTNLTNILSLIKLDISYNSISDIIEYNFSSNHSSPVTKMSSSRRLISLSGMATFLNKRRVVRSFIKFPIEFRDISKTPISNYPKLQELNISQNKFSSLHNFRNLRSLTKLNAKSNCIKHIPRLNYPNLWELDVFSNHLGSLDGICNFPTLTELKVSPGQVENLSNIGHPNLRILSAKFCERLQCPKCSRILNFLGPENFPALEKFRT